MRRHNAHVPTLSALWGPRSKSYLVIGVGLSALSSNQEIGRIPVKLRGYVDVSHYVHRAPSPREITVGRCDPLVLSSLADPLLKLWAL